MIARPTRVSLRALLLAAGIAVLAGCASTAEIEAARADAQQALQTAQEAQRTAQQALQAAEAAQAAADRGEQCCQDLRQELNRAVERMQQK